MRTIAAPHLWLLFGTLALALPLWLAGCTDAGKCTRGEIGCACTTSNRCDSGARCSAGMCVKSSGTSGSGGSTAGGGGSSGTSSPPSECSDDSFAEACESFCQAMCSNQEALCLSSSCSASDCDEDACAEACDDDVQCIVRACKAQLAMTCETFGAKDAATGVFKSFCFETDPMCVPSPDLGCSDTCGTLSNRTGGQLAKNDSCEDGGEGSSGMARCTRGTDCTDCGARMCATKLESCSRNGDCCGWTSGESFCVDTGGGQVCLAACGADVPCEGDEICTPLRQGDDMVCVP